jgi:flagellar motor switch protein FliG
VARLALTFHGREARMPSMNMKDRVNKAYGASAPGKGEASKEPAPGKTTARGGSKRPIVPKEESFPPDPPASKKPGRGSQAQARGAAARGITLGDALAAAGDEATLLLKTGSESGIAKAAKFLLLLGTDEASKVLSHLKPEEVEAVSREILKVKDIGAPEANDILAEFGWLVKTQGWSVEGGPETAEKMLVTAFGPEKAAALMRKAAPESQKPFKFLEGYEAKDLFLLLKDESPQVLSVIIPYLDPKKASLIIQRLGDEARVDLVKRIAKLDKINPEVLKRVEEGMKERIRKVGRVDHEEIDGKAALAGILKHVAPGLEERVLGALNEENPELSKNVRDQLFTLEDVIRVPDRALQKALRDFQDRDLALVLKGRDEAFKKKLLSNVSANRKSMILDEYAILGPVRREDANEAAKELLDYLKRAREDGDLALEGDDEMVE